VEPLAEIDDQIVAVRSDKILGTSFHPELTGDTRIHEYFLSF
ncbi:MAG: pyridoxal 5'-phosphate synthase glutaminase subunit PdxT, partial [Fimbriimonadales bacterium]